MKASVLGGALAVLLSACPPQPTPEPDASTPDADVTLDASAPGNSCLSAIPLVLPIDGGVLVVTGDATGFADHATCSPSRGLGPPVGVGPDVLYRFTTTQPLALEAGIDGGTLHLGVGACEVNCGDFALGPRRGQPFNREALRVELPAGEHTLWAEAPGAYTFELRTRPLLHGETCADPIVVGPDAGTLHFEAADFFDEGWPAAPLGCTFNMCSASISVALVTTERAGLRTTVSSPVSGLFVQAMDGCDESFVTLEGEGRVLEPGTRLVALRMLETSALGRASYPVELTLNVLPLQPGDTCDAPVPLTLASADGGSALTATVTGDTTNAFSSRGHTCGELTSNDVFFTFTLERPSDLLAEVTTTSATFQPALGLRPGTCEGLEASCAGAIVPGAGATLRGTALPVGTYFLPVRSVNGSAGPFRLQVDVTPR